MRNLLTFSSVSLRYGKNTVLDNFNLTLNEGEHTVIMGPSGCGKTSILRLAAGLIKPSCGIVTRSASRISVQFQEPRLLPTLTAAENVNVVLSDKKETLPAALAFLDQVEVSQGADLYPRELSGGMAQRVALARALAYGKACGCELYLLDEPFRGLDPQLRDRMIALVKEYTQQASLLLITHDAAVAEQFTEKPLLLK